MLTKLRWQLTLLYLAVGAALVMAVAASAYLIVSYQFQRTTDRALQHVMAEHMVLLGEPLPPELAEAEQAWYQSSTGLLPPQISAALLPFLPDDSQETEFEIHESPEEQALDAELAAIFVLALDDSGRLLPGFNTEAAPLQPEVEAVEEAAEHAYDWRTIRPSRNRVRLLTYRLGSLVEPSYLQVGRSMADQDGLRQVLAISLLFFGSLSLVVLGTASWWLAGRSIRPTEEAMARQQAFVANASHELKTPLTLIRSSAEVALRSTKPKSEAAEFLKEIVREAEHMDRLVEDQLLLSRLDQGQVELTLQPVPLDPMLRDIKLQLERLPAADGKQLKFRLEPCWAQGDPTRIRQILLILLDNALRYTPSGGTIEVNTSCHQDKARIRIIDDGPGIPVEDLSRITDRFYRVDPARGRDSGGSGLGLSIAKTLVQAHKGSLSIESQPGMGTTVEVELPSIERQEPSQGGSTD